MSGSLATALALAFCLAALMDVATASKCTTEELQAFHEEYEQCHGRALEKLLSDTVARPL